MSIVALVTRAEDIGAALGWSRRLSEAHGLKLHLVALALDPRAELQEDVSWDVESSEPLVEAARQAGRILSPQPQLHSGRGPKLDELTAELVTRLEGRLLVLPWLPPSAGGDRWQSRVHAAAPCDVMLLRTSAESAETCARILIPCSEGPHCRAGLSWVKPLISDETRLTALHVTDGFDEQPVTHGERLIQRALKSAGIEASEAILPKVLIADSPFAGISAEAKEGYDLVLVGATSKGVVSRMLGRTVPERLLLGKDAVALAVLRKAAPLRARLWDKAQGWLRQRVPQLTREERIELYERMEAGARGDFDFFALTGLATSIAALGLIQDSGAVVIGAMLVAPLMVPMIGAGLGLIQGNSVLVRRCARSVALGFLMALGLGALCGLIFGGSIPDELTRQLNARGQVSELDLFVALISGIAAAYANARPNLSSALPGVAIAAALVPPIATAGIALSCGQGLIARNALTLFGTNLVCIVLGAALALWALGVRGNPDFSRKRIWTRRGLVLLVLLATALLFILGSHVLTALE